MEYLTAYTGNMSTERTRFEQGGIQIAGLAIAAGLGIFAGVITGFLTKTINRRE